MRQRRSDISDREALEACWPWGGPAAGAHPGALGMLIGHGWNEKVALAKLEQLDERRWIECGTSISYAWRTPLGEEILAGLIEEERA